MNDSPFFTLIREAREMLLDRHPEERELIYAIAILEEEERSAIIIAYKDLSKEEEDG